MYFGLGDVLSTAAGRCRRVVEGGKGSPMVNITLVVLLLSGAGESIEPLEELTSQFASPVRIISSGEPIDVLVGHAAPYLHDFDGDGLKDLLVGEFGKESFPGDRLPAKYRKSEGDSGYAQGRLRIYKNYGSKFSPEYRGFEYLKAGEEFASIPST